jgi:hypothetical protein
MKKLAAVLCLAPLAALAQELDPGASGAVNSVLQALPLSPQARTLIVTLLPVAYLGLLLARRFVPPTTPVVGPLIRTLLLGWKHPDEKPAPNPGIPTNVLKVAVLVIGSSLLFAAPARADQGAPPLGGAFKVGQVQASYGPRILPGMLALNFKTGDVAAVAIAGLGYGLDFWSDKPYSVGVAGFLGAQVGNATTPSAISTGLVATVFKYAVVGFHYGVSGGVRATSLVVGPSYAF